MPIAYPVDGRASTKTGRLHTVPAPTPNGHVSSLQAYVPGNDLEIGATLAPGEVPPVALAAITQVSGWNRG